MNLSTYLIVLRQKALNIRRYTKLDVRLIRKFVKILNLFLEKECGEVAQLTSFYYFSFFKNEIEKKSS